MALEIIAFTFFIFACIASFFAGYYIKDIKGTVTIRYEGNPTEEPKKEPTSKQFSKMMAYNGRKGRKDDK